MCSLFVTASVGRLRTPGAGDSSHKWLVTEPTQTAALLLGEVDVRLARHLGIALDERPSAILATLDA